MSQLLKRSLTVAMSVALTIGVAAVGSAAASAYQTTPGSVYVAENPEACNKRPCVLYPKTAQLPSGRIVAAFEDSESAVVGQTLPVRKSDDFGATWQPLANVKAPAELSTDPRYARYTSNWTNPYLYVMPQAVGDLAAGTLLLASIVSGDDEYYNEQKAADSSWVPSGDGDRRDLAIALYSSTDEGASWNVVNVIATGSWQGGSAGALGRTSNANTYHQVDPVWEPYLMVHDGRLVAYYSDENDYLGFDPTTGVPIVDPENDTAPDSYGQILVHRTWDGLGAWSEPVVDVAGLTETRENGKTQIGGGRPGMETVVPTTDGKWLVTYEYFGGGDNVRYKISDDPLAFYSAGDADGDDIGLLPTSGPRLSTGGSPVLTTFPDGRIVFNAAGSGNVWVNESGRSDGIWKAYQTPISGGYSRNLQYVDGTGRLLILQASWEGGSIGPIRFAEVDLGSSEGAYYSLVNRQTGQVLSTAADKTQDVNLSGDVPEIITWSNNPANNTQRWHVTPKGSNVTFLNKAGGRALAIYFGNASAGSRIVQWVDDGGSDKLWTLVPTGDGYVKIQSAKNAALYMTAGGAGGPVSLGASTATVGDSAADDAQEWKLVQEAPTAASLTSRYESYALMAVDEVSTGGSLELNAAVAEPRDVTSHANAFGHAYAIAGSGAAIDLGVVQFNADEKAAVALPASLTAGTTAKLVVLFDATPAVWDTVAIVEERLDVSVVVSARCVAGKVIQTVTVANEESLPVTVSLAGPYGNKSLGSLAAGKVASAAFSTRLPSIPSGNITATANGTLAGQPVTTTTTVPFVAASCG